VPGKGKANNQRFLDGKIDMTGNKVALCSYPRSGNSFTRSYLEKITGITTGGEAYSDPTLQLIGLIGEGHNADDMVWVNKTHYPINAPMLVNSLNINKQIYLMRNPIDVILSCANMTQTTSHELVPKEEYYKDFPEFWDEWISSMVNSMQNFHSHVLNVIAL
jgi:hypothetical protein